jgi:thiamine kinase-like enzyme
VGTPSEQWSDQATRLLARIPGWAGRAVATGLLGGGITNRNVLVELGSERFVLRLAGPSTALLEIRRPDEAVAARRAAALGIGPEVMAFLEPEGCLVSRWIDATTLASDELRAPESIVVVARMLRRVHAQPLLDGDFDAFRVPRLHRDAAAAQGVAVPDAFVRADALASRIEAAFGCSPDARVPAHNDLLAANFLRSADGHLWLIDWEYAGNNDRYFDLGNLAVNNSFGSAEELLLLRSYFGEVTPRRLARLQLMRMMSDFREAMWAVVQQGISTLDFDYAAYGGLHFDRLLAQAAEGDLERLLDDAAQGPPESGP